MQVLTKERPMFSIRKKILAIIVLAGLLPNFAMMKTAFAAAQSAKATPQTANTSAGAPVPDAGKVAAGQTEAARMLLLMDADKNGKISRAEYMAFMAAEFDRLDINRDGELDVKELEKSQLMVAHRGGQHR
jgi:hypothetical protein